MKLQIGDMVVVVAVGMVNGGWVVMVEVEMTIVKVVVYSGGGNAGDGGGKEIVMV